MIYAYISQGVVMAVMNQALNSIEGVEFDSVIPYEDFQVVEVNDTIRADGALVSHREQLPKNCITKLQFLQRFTIYELAAIEASTDNIIKALQHQQSVSNYTELFNPQVIQGVDYMIAVGLIAPERKAAILAVEP
jgi:hypothetical protein